MHHSKYIISKQGKKGACAVFGRCVQYVCRVWCVILASTPVILDLRRVSRFTHFL